MEQERIEHESNENSQGQTPRSITVLQTRADGTKRSCHANDNSLVAALGLASWHWDTALRVTLPPGISFYTFQSMSYTIDVHRGDVVFSATPADPAGSTSRPLRRTLN